MTTAIEPDSVEFGVSLEEQVLAVRELLRLPGEMRLVGEVSGLSVPVPNSVRELLDRLLAQMQSQNATSIRSPGADLTTQQAAEILGVSRPFLVKLLDSGQLPHHLVGTHRRVYRIDLLEYKEYRDRERRQALNRIAQADEDAGLYDKVVLPEE